MSEALLTEWLLAYFHQRLPFPKEWLPQGSYWVGGSLRDAYLAWLRGQSGDSQGPVDLDLMCPADPVGWAAGVARRLKAGFVVLDAERQIARIVLGQGGASPPTVATVDVALQAGPTPEADLRQRDFTCNALALELREGQLLDPTGGRADIQQGCCAWFTPTTSAPIRCGCCGPIARQPNWGLRWIRPRQRRFASGLPSWPMWQQNGYEPRW
jgi:tRNA nucleotidyltransferase (CCA-adding enzyme)